MCVEEDATPPVLPDGLARGEAPTAERFVVTSLDGHDLSAALARPGAPNRTGVVVLPDIRGLFAFYEQLAERFAQAGYPAIVFDYYGRTAGLGPREDGFEFRPHLEGLTVDQVQADLGAVLSELRTRTGVERIVAVGFCFGGSNAFLAGTLPELDGVVGFYGILSPSRLPHPASVAGAVRVPVLGLFGGSDHAVPRADVENYERALTEAGVVHELVTYPGAPHSFFDRSAAEHAAASEDAWRRVLAFIAGIG